MAVSIKVPGSCGELVQGVIDGTSFLVTCPINVFTTAVVNFGPNFCSEKPMKEKARQAIKKSCIQLGVNEKNLTLELSSQLIRSKGMSSSSADIAAVCKAIAVACNKDMTDSQIAKIAAAIEPTDGIFCRGIVKFDHIHGKILQYLGPPPRVKIVIFDCGGDVDTVLFNQRDELPFLNRQKEHDVRQALKFIEYGILNNDIGALGRGATISAFANQAILFKPQLQQVWNIAKEYKAAGVNVAHSGTLIGVIFAASVEKDVLNEYIGKTDKYCRDIKYLFTADLISGGFYIMKNC
ncbi:GHMP family kinase ATP-binding protein [Pectinatus sottacetonis]|uniref:GHMP family kinase ATP-binding protein n=1 Tax=Pectinatus sottacetonis TaxID=1002795 RepID=UPI0018C77C66|nr:hypothetical protein [Pectinatus sottacetonis]